MKILILEDRGSVTHYMKEYLENEGHIVYVAFNINDANNYMGKDTYDCLIIDLNMKPEGLTEEEVQETIGGLLTSWIWLKKYVYNNKPDYKEKTIIYSEYTNRLRENVSSGELEGLRIVQKREYPNPVKQLLNHMRDIEKSGKS